MGHREFVHRVGVVALFHLIELCGFVPPTKLLHRTDAVRDFDPSDIVTVVRWTHCGAVPSGVVTLSRRTFLSATIGHWA